MLAQVDEQLPFAGHVSGTFQQLHFVQWLFATRYFVRSQKIVVSNPERNTVQSAVFCTVATESAVSFFECTVEPLYDLFERPILLGYCIVIGQSDYLCDEDIPVLLELELLRSKRVSTVTVSNEFQSFGGEFFKLVESHAHGKDAGTHITGGGNLVSEDGARYFVHDKPDVSLHALDFDVGLISSQLVGRVVVIGVHERTDEYGGGFGIIVDHGM